jgi:hypothetical protein
LGEVDARNHFFQSSQGSDLSGLDGVRMVDPSTSRTLRIYPLETIQRWEVNEPSVFTFWAKSAVDFEQCTIRLQSSTHTINAILDTITAACVQVCVSQLGFAFNIVMESLLLLQKLVYDSLSKSVTYHGMSFRCLHI